MKQFWVYILASEKYGTLYVGVTSNLTKRLYEHQNDQVDGFTKEHHVHQLVYMEPHVLAEQAIIREKQIKRWKRDWKINLIEKENPYWEDLSKDLLAVEPRNGSLPAQG